MRKILQFACVLLIASRCFCSIALVQSKAGGSASGSVAFLGTVTTNAVGFSSTTGAGNLLVLVIWQNGGTTGDVISITTMPISGGYSPSDWLSAAANQSAGNDDGGITYCSGVGIFAIPNAPSMTSSQTTTVTARNNGAAGTIKVEFAMYEFSGVAASPIYDLTSFDGQGVDFIGDSGTPGGNWVSGFGISPTAHTDLIIVAMQAQAGSNLTAGTGYTLGINASVATIGQVMYQLNAPPGQTSASFVGSDNFWSVAALAFNAASAGGGSVSRHKGSVF